MNKNCVAFMSLSKYPLAKFITIVECKLLAIKVMSNTLINYMLLLLVTFCFEIIKDILLTRLFEFFCLHVTIMIASIPSLTICTVLFTTDVIFHLPNLSFKESKTFLTYI